MSAADPNHTDKVIPVWASSLGAAVGHTLRGQLFQGIGSIILAAILVWTATFHIANPYLFLDSVLRYRILGPTLAMYTAMYLPFFQYVLAASLMTVRLRPAAQLLCMAVFLSFAMAHAIVLMRGESMECGCFPLLARFVSVGTLLLNLTLTTLAWLLWRFEDSDDACGTSQPNPS